MGRCDELLPCLCVYEVLLPSDVRVEVGIVWVQGHRRWWQVDAVMAVNWEWQLGSWSERELRRIGRQ